MLIIDSGLFIPYSSLSFGERPKTIYCYSKDMRPSNRKANSLEQINWFSYMLLSICHYSTHVLQLYNEVWKYELSWPEVVRWGNYKREYIKSLVYIPYPSELFANGRVLAQPSLDGMKSAMWRLFAKINTRLSRNRWPCQAVWFEV